MIAIFTQLDLLFQIPDRQVAGTFLKNTLFSNDKATFVSQTQLYSAIPATVRQAVKTCTLQSLLSPHREIRLAAASAACHVAVAELTISTSGWDEFFVGLVQLAQQTQTEEACGRAESALKCIGTLHRTFLF
jgi:biotin synthase-like enzyme